MTEIALLTVLTGEEGGRSGPKQWSYKNLSPQPQTKLAEKQR